MDDDRIAFQDTLGECIRQVESGRMTPKLQAFHAPPCKFQTAFMIFHGICHLAVGIHDPKG
jgi:hypothetical protein